MPLLTREFRRYNIVDILHESRLQRQIRVYNLHHNVTISLLLLSRKELCGSAYLYS